MSDVAQPSGALRLRLWGEMAVFLVGGPIAMTALHGRAQLFAGLIAATSTAALLLHLTPGFRWRSLLKGPVLSEWRWFLGYVALVSTCLVILVLLFAPERFLAFPRYRFDLWLTVMMAYPFLSALPQELIYRALFFERYGALFPSPRVAILVNAALFGLAHLFYGTHVAVLLAAAGGVAMAAGYLRHRSFLFAVLLHATAGQILFTVGLGVYFYHGSIGATP